jgi:hypothetical protein
MRLKSRITRGNSATVLHYFLKYNLIDLFFKYNTYKLVNDFYILKRRIFQLINTFVILLKGFKTLKKFITLRI